MTDVDSMTREQELQQAFFLAIKSVGLSTLKASSMFGESERSVVVQDYLRAEIERAIRALATPDQTSALERVKAEAKAEGMRTAARITRVEAERLPISLHDAALKCEAAILAAIETLRVNGGEA